MRRVQRVRAGAVRAHAFTRRTRLPANGLLAAKFPTTSASRALWFLRQRRDHFVCRLAAVERQNQQLDDRHGAVDRAGVAPGLEVVSRGNVPVAQRRRFVEEQSGVNDKVDLAIASANFRSAGAV